MSWDEKQQLKSEIVVKLHLNSISQKNTKKSKEK